MLDNGIRKRGSLMVVRSGFIGWALVITLTVCCIAGAWSAFAGEPGGASPSTRPSSTVVVELFTSQGCSSCPPAEQYLSELKREVQRDGRPVFTLAFHVDYWNHLGWSDSFSSPDFSLRQQRYSKALKLDQIYTPQMVVNGQVQFVGSDRETAERAIAEALAVPQTASVSLAVSAGRESYKVRAKVAGAPADAVVNIAIVEEGLFTEVKAGENRGRRIDESSVVRWFKTVATADAGDITVPALPKIRADRASVIVYAQLPGNGRIIGAASAALP